jgi:hypothetical protein
VDVVDRYIIVKILIQFFNSIANMVDKTRLYQVECSFLIHVYILIKIINCHCSIKSNISISFLSNLVMIQKCSGFYSTFFNIKLH